MKPVKQEPCGVPHRVIQATGCLNACSLAPIIPCIGNPTFPSVDFRRYNETSSVPIYSSTKWYCISQYDMCKAVAFDNFSSLIYRTGDVMLIITSPTNNPMRILIRSSYSSLTLLFFPAQLITQIAWENSNSSNNERTYMCKNTKNIPRSASKTCWVSPTNDMGYGLNLIRRSWINIQRYLILSWKTV